VIALPEVAQGTWKGATLLAATKRVFPLVTVRLAFRGGAVLDPPGKEGLSSLTARMLERGTKTRNHTQVVDAIEAIGGTIGSGASYESIRLEGTLLGRSLDRWLEIVSDMLLEPAFSEKELSFCKAEMIAELAMHREEDRDLGDMFYRRALWGDSPYGRFSEGTEASLPSLTREDVVRRWREGMVRSRLLVGVAGDLDLEQLGKLLDKHLGALPQGDPIGSTTGAPRPLSGVEVLLVDKPDRTQTQIFLGRTCPGPSHEDYLPFSIANHAFGGMFTSRFMQEVRVKRGWSYGAYTRVETLPEASSFAAWTFPSNDDTLPAVRLLLDLVKSFAGEGISEAELEAGKSHLKNAMAFDLETPEAQLARRMNEIALRLPDDWTPRFLRAVEAATLERANASARAMLDGKPLVLTVVCTADRFVEELAKFPEVSRIDVVPFDTREPGSWTNVFRRSSS
jgi:zinc protease